MVKKKVKGESKVSEIKRTSSNAGKLTKKIKLDIADCSVDLGLGSRAARWHRLQKLREETNWNEAKQDTFDVTPARSSSQSIVKMSRKKVQKKENPVKEPILDKDLVVTKGRKRGIQISEDNKTVQEKKKKSKVTAEIDEVDSDFETTSPYFCKVKGNTAKKENTNINILCNEDKSLRPINKDKSLRKRKPVNDKAKSTLKPKCSVKISEEKTGQRKIAKKKPGDVKLKNKGNPMVDSEQTSPSSSKPSLAYRHHVPDEDSDSSDSDWQEVEDAAGNSPEKSQVPKKGVEIVLESTEVNKKRKEKKKFDVEAYFKRVWNKWIKEQREDKHRVHLLLLLARGRYLNSLCNDTELCAIVLSLVPIQILKLHYKSYSVDTLIKITKVFRSVITLKEWEQATFYDGGLMVKLVKSFHNKTADTPLLYVLMFVLFLRAIGVRARLVIASNPLPWKQSTKKSVQAKPKMKKQLSLSETESTESANNKSKQSLRKRKSQRPTSKVKYQSNSENESDFSDAEFSAKLKSKRSETTKNDKRSLEEKRTQTKSPSPSSKKTTKVSEGSASYEWVEVYLEMENKWITIDCVKGRVDHPSDIEKQVESVVYVLTYDNDGAVKDVTKRYASGFVMETRKVRVDDNWWTSTLAPYKTTDTDLDKIEDIILHGELLKQPFPESIAGFKSHPLYALKRYLLKFEAIYPESSVPLGFIRNEPIYAREVIHTTHSKEHWLQRARGIKEGETSYKMVKSNSRKSLALAKSGKKQPMLETFGFWQTEDYVPPPVVDGIVPKNQWGNLELYEPIMLPLGTVHLNNEFESIGKIAKKLKIDYAPAMVGWDIHHGWNHPMIDGIIVCEEYKDTLIAAWDEEQIMMEEKQIADREKRALTNWKMMVKGLFLRQRLKKVFDLQEPPAKINKTGAESSQETATDVQMSWPRNRQPENQTKFTVEEI